MAASICYIYALLHNALLAVPVLQYQSGQQAKRFLETMQGPGGALPPAPPPLEVVSTLCVCLIYVAHLKMAGKPVIDEANAGKNLWQPCAGRKEGFLLCCSSPVDLAAGAAWTCQRQWSCHLRRSAESCPGQPADQWAQCRRRQCSDKPTW